MSEIKHLIGALEPLIHEYGAAAIMVDHFLETLGAPLPEKRSLVFASALAARGELSWPTLFAAAWAGAALGDNTGFAIGRVPVASSSPVMHPGRLGAERLDKVEAVSRNTAR